MKQLLTIVAKFELRFLRRFPKFRSLEKQAKSDAAILNLPPYSPLLQRILIFSSDILQKFFP